MRDCSRRPSSWFWAFACSSCHLLRIEPVVVLGELGERVPEALLGLHAAAQALELEHAAERRVAGELLVGLQAAELLADLGAGDLQRRLGDAEAIHHLFEHLDVGLDLLREADEEVLVGGADVLVGEPVGEL